MHTVLEETVIRGHRLGRHVHHDPLSRSFPAAAGRSIVSVNWSHHGPVLDQGQLGSCTGNALVDCLMSGPLYRPGRDLTEAHALRAYELATTIDPFPGSYPPDDTGSDGPDACKAGKQHGWLIGYTHTFTQSHALRALTPAPAMVATEWRT